MVNIQEKDETLRMSKRSGNAVPLYQLIKDVGVDAARYFFFACSNDSQLDFDTELAKSKSNENTIYYVQYAHARICTMLANANERGIYTEEDFYGTLWQDEIELE